MLCPPCLQGLEPQRLRQSILASSEPSHGNHQMAESFVKVDSSTSRMWQLGLKSIRSLAGEKEIPPKRCNQGHRCKMTRSMHRMMHVPNMHPKLDEFRILPAEQASKAELLLAVAKSALR